MSQETQRKKDDMNQRLEKLFTSNRDLTLSNKSSQRTQPSKKIFAPNLKATRNKNADNIKPVAKDIKKDESKQRRNKEDKLPARKGNNYIQTFGFLSEGIAAQHQKRYETPKASRDNCEEMLSRPKIVKQESVLSTMKSDVVESEQILANLIGNEVGEDLKQGASLEDGTVPIKIKKYAVNADTISDIKIKKEPIDDEILESLNCDQFTVNDRSSRIQVGKLMELFTASLDDLMIFQFPDTLPGKLLIDGDDETDVETEDNSVATSNLQVKSKMPKLYSLSNVDEGLIGKIVRHKSGKTRFLLGDAVYNIERGVSSEFQQNVVVIDSRVDERSTNIYNLGPLKAKYVCSPDWQWLFQKISE